MVHLKLKCTPSSFRFLNTSLLVSKASRSCCDSCSLLPIFVVFCVGGIILFAGNQLDQQCRRTSSANKRATVSTQSTRSTVPATISSATTVATPLVVHRSRRTYDDRSAEQQIKFCVYHHARYDSSTFLTWRSTNDEYKSSQKIGDPAF